MAQCCMLHGARQRCRPAAAHPAPLPAQVLVYFAVAKKGDPPTDGKTDVNPEGLTAAYGPHAAAVAARLHAAGLSCKVGAPPLQRGGALACKGHAWSQDHHRPACCCCTPGIGPAPECRQHATERRTTPNFNPPASSAIPHLPRRCLTGQSSPRACWRSWCGSARSCWWGRATAGAPWARSSRRWGARVAGVGGDGHRQALLHSGGLPGLPLPLRAACLHWQLPWQSRVTSACAAPRAQQRCLLRLPSRQPCFLVALPFSELTGALKTALGLQRALACNLPNPIKVLRLHPAAPCSTRARSAPSLMSWQPPGLLRWGSAWMPGRRSGCARTPAQVGHNGPERVQLGCKHQLAALSGGWERCRARLVAQC